MWISFNFNYCSIALALLWQELGQRVVLIVKQCVQVNFCLAEFVHWAFVFRAIWDEVVAIRELLLRRPRKHGKRVGALVLLLLWLNHFLRVHHSTKARTRSSKSLGAGCTTKARTRSSEALGAGCSTKARARLLVKSAL